MPSTQPPRQVNLLAAAACITWLTVLIALWLSLGPQSALQRVAYILLMVSILVAFFWVTHPSFQTREIQLRSVLALAWQPLAVLAVQLITEDPTVHILLIIWCAQLPFFMRPRSALGLGAVAIAASTAVRVLWHGDTVHILQPFLYFMFCAFAVLMAHSTALAEAAQATLAQRNAELLATREVLARSAEENERLRIARDLHDALGHHLTALALQLDIAQRVHGDAQHDAVKQAHQLTKLLLADVRATVSNLRQAPSLSVQELLTPVIANVPGLRVTLDAKDLCLSRAVEAETVLRATQEILSNSLRHGGAHAVVIRVMREADQVVLLAEDDGCAPAEPRAGNGLKGLQERAAQLGGRCEYGLRVPQGFYVRVCWPAEPLPVTGASA